MTTGVAHAYRRETVDDLPDGAPLYWPERSLGFRDELTRIPGVTPLEGRAALLASLATWTRAGGCTDVTLNHLGAATSDRTSLSGGAPDGENRVVVRMTNWPARVGMQTLAVTTVVYERSSAHIVDADIDVNAVNQGWSTDDAPAGTNDLENTLTHELGHVLGFAHSEVPEATMFAEADLGETLKRDLAADDVDAVCTVYPPLPTSTCSASPGHATLGWMGWLSIAWALAQSRSRTCTRLQRGC